MSLAATRSVRIRRPANQLKPKIRVMLVDDLMVARTVACRALATSPEIEIVASVGNGKIAIDTIVEAAPDVVVLDIEMPVMSGIEALPHLLKRRPGLKNIIASTFSEQNAEISIKALRAGAVDVLLKPSSQDGLEAAKEFGEALKRKVMDFGAASAVAVLPRRPVPQPDRAATLAKVRRTGRPRVLAIGSSTGGPDALAQTLQNWAA
jgi:two-component system chemotaxis response regulator CheB